MSKLKEQKIALLKSARKMLKRGDEEYICHGIVKCDGTWHLRESDQSKACQHLTKYIVKALAPQGEFEDWQRANGLFKSHKQCHKDRIKWVGWMIDSLEGKL